MMTPQQAYRLFVHADHAMILVALAALVASIGWGICAILLVRKKDRRRQTLQKALISFLVFAMFWGTQASVTIAFFNDHWTPLLAILFALPVVVMLTGLVTSVVYGTHAILRRTGTERRNIVLKSLLGVAIFGVGVAPHTTAMLMPVISTEDHSNRPGTLTRKGDAAPDFELPTIEGNPFRTADSFGRVTVLNFFATWCGPCQKELPNLQSIWDEFRSNSDFRMLVVGREESEDVVKAFQQKHGFTFPMASDADRSVYSEFASGGIPRTYVISRQGTIAYQWTGHYDAEIAKLRKLLRKELAKEK